MISREAFDQLVREVEDGVGRNPRALRLRTAGWAAVGYAGLLSGLVLVLAVAGALLVPAVTHKFSEGFLLYVFGAIVLVFGGWSVGRALWITRPPPAGREVTRDEVPALFAELERLRSQLCAAAFHRVLLVSECNAGVCQEPRLGLLGWPRNHLLLGLPLLDGLTPDEFRAVLAHELAHLSRGHGSFGHWIYRLRRSWEQVFAQLQQPRVANEVSLRPLIVRFVEWLWPRFNACAFVLSRANEYEADRVAAQLAAAEPLATALTRLAVNDRLLVEKFWPAVWLAANRETTPPPDVFTELRRVLAAGPARDDGVRWLAEAARAATTNADTHPALRDRLRALGCEPRPLGPVSGPTAAEHFLAAALPRIRTDVEAAWRKTIDPQWRERHAKAAALQHRLTTLDAAVPAARVDVDSLWDKARALIDLEGDRAAAPLLRQILALQPAHPAANFCLGCHLLDSGDAGGEAHLERAMAEDVEALPSAIARLQAWCHRTGRTDRLRELDARLDRHEKNRTASQRERGAVTAGDVVLAHELSEPELLPLRQLLAAETDVVAAWLGRKQLQHFPKQPLFLLCLATRRAWHRLPDRDRDQAIINRLLLHTQLPGRVFIFAFPGTHDVVAKKLRQQTSLEIFRR